MVTNFHQQNHEIILGGDFNEKHTKGNVTEDITEKSQII
jgi:hypothetical protein